MSGEASTPFRERNPVVIGAVGLAVIAAMLLLAFNIDKLPLLGGPSPLGGAVARPAASRPATTCASPGSRSARSRRSTSRATTSGSTSGSNRSTDLGRPDRGLGPDQDHPGPEVPGARARPARASLDKRDPAVAHDIRRTTSSRRSATSRPPTEDDRHRPAGRRARHDRRRRSATRPTRSGPPSTGLGRLSRTIASPRRRSCASCSTHANGVTGVLADRNEELVGAARRRRPAAAGAAQAARGHPHAAGQHVDAVRSSSPAWSATTAQAIGPALANLQERARDAARQPGQPRPEHPAARAVRPGLRQHPRQRPLVRHLHPEPRARARADRGARHEPPARSAPPRLGRRCWLVARSRCVLLAAAAAPRTSRPTSPARSASTRAPTCASSASRSARSRTVTPEGDRCASTSIRRQVQGAGRRQGRRRRAVARERPLRAAHPGLHGGARARRRRRHPARAAPQCPSSSTGSSPASTTSTSRSAPRAPTRTARCPGCWQVGADNLDGKGANINQTVTDLSKALTHPVRRPRRPVRHGAQPAGLHRGAGHERQPGRGRSTPTWPASPTSSPASAATSALALKNLAVALGEVASFVKDNRGQPHHRHRGARGHHRHAGQAEGTRSAESSTPARSRCPTCRTPTTRRPGTLDTRDNAQQLEDPGAVPLLAAHLGRASRKSVCDQIDKVLKNQQAPQARQLRPWRAPVERPGPHPRRHPRGATPMSGPDGPRRPSAAAARAPCCSHGCQGVYDLPLPGRRGDRAATPTTSRPSSRDVLDLVPQSAVKVNDVTVGAVDEITLDGWHARGHAAAAQRRAAAGQRRRRAAPDQPAGREVRLARAADRPAARGPARRRRHHPAVPHRPQPRGRGGARRAVAAAQRRRRRPAQDHQRRARPGDGRARGATSRARSASSTRSSAAWTQQKAEIVRALDGLDRLTAHAGRAEGRHRDGPRQPRPRA